MKIHPNSVWRRRLDGRLARIIFADDSQVAFDLDRGPYRNATTTREFLNTYLLIDVHPTKKMLIRAVLLSAPTDLLPLMALADALEEQQDPDAVHFRELLTHSPGKAFALASRWTGVIEW